MHRLPNPEEILEKLIHSAYQKGKLYKDLIEAVKEYGRQVRDKTLDWASKNAEVKEQWEFVLSLGDDDHPGETSYYVDKQSILKGKISKDLEI